MTVTHVDPNEPLPGLYRAKVEDTNDPEAMRRYKIRVDALHSDATALEALPWADLSCFAGPGFGDLPAFEQGDLVWVMFEGGHAEYPVIIGGILHKQYGIGPLPAEMRANYGKNRFRWMRYDRAGNIIEMSYDPGDKFLRVQSGDTEILLSNTDKGISVTAKSNVSIQTAQGSITAQEFNLTLTKFGTIQVDGDLTITTGQSTVLHSSDTVLIGHYRDPMWPVSDVHTTKTVRIQSTDLIHIETDQAYRLKNKTHTSETTDTYSHRTGGTHSIVSHDKMSITVEQGGYALTVLKGDATVKVSAGNLTADVTGNAKVSCTGTMDLQSTGAMSLKSSSQISMSAPTISVTADAALTLKGATTSLEGTTSLSWKSPVVNGASDMMTTIKGGQLTNIQSAIVKLN